MLSDKQFEIYKQINESKEPKDEKTKMTWNLNDKNKYVVHIRTLQMYLKRGLNPKKMHRAIKFEPKEIRKPHIEFNSDKRKNARDDFEKDIFKLLNNASKFMVMRENLRNVRAQQKYSKTKKSIRWLQSNIRNWWSYT